MVGNPQLITLRLLSTHHPWVKWQRNPRSVAKTLIHARICYLDVNWLISLKISACRASKANESQASYSVEHANIFQYQSYSHSDDILKSNINTDIWYI